MPRLLFALLLGAATAGGTVVDGNGTPVLVEGKSRAASDPALVADMQAQQAIDEAVAAALIGALRSRFEGEDIELRLGSGRSERVSLRDIALQGEAQIRFGGAASWLPVRFEALYDTDKMVVESPHITLGAELAKARPAESLPLARLQAQVDRAVAAGHPSNSVEVTLGSARIVDDDGRRYVVQADAVARFDRQDEVPMRVHALYDRQTGRWLDPQYDFDDAGYGLAAR